MRGPIAEAHAHLIEGLQALTPPSYSIDPMPYEHEAVADYILAVARLGDTLMSVVGIEAQANAHCRINQDCFRNRFEHAVEGFAVFELEQAAEACRENQIAERAEATNATLDQMAEW